MKTVITSVADDQCEYMTTDIGFSYCYNDEVLEGVSKLEDDCWERGVWMTLLVSDIPSMKKEDKVMVYNLFVLHAIEQLAMYAHYKYMYGMMNGDYDTSVIKIKARIKELSKCVRQ